MQQVQHDNCLPTNLEEWQHWIKNGQHSIWERLSSWVCSCFPIEKQTNKFFAMLRSHVSTYSLLDEEPATSTTGEARSVPSCFVVQRALEKRSVQAYYTCELRANLIKRCICKICQESYWTNSEENHQRGYLWEFPIWNYLLGRRHVMARIPRLYLLECIQGNFTILDLA